MTFAEKNWGDCSKAVAYELNFVGQCLGYDNDNDDAFVEDCTCGLKTHQEKDLKCPKSGVLKKDYFVFYNGESCVSEKLKDNMLLFGITEDFFRPIKTKTEQVVGYQIVPKVVLPHIYHLNDTRVIFTCPKCGEKKFEVMYYGGDYDIDGDFDNRAYKGIGYPEYISEEALKVINREKIVRTKENANTIISLDLYSYLIKNYPRLECRPVFLGNLKDDREYRRIRKEGEDYRVINRDCSMDKIEYFTEFITVQKDNPEIKMVLYAVKSFKGIKCNFYENVNGEYRCITSEEFSLEDIKDGYYSDPEEILCVEKCRQNVDKIVGGFIPPKSNGIILNKNYPVKITELKYKNKKYKFWYAVMKRNEDIDFFQYI